MRTLMVCTLLFANKSCARVNVMSRSMGQNGIGILKLSAGKLVVMTRFSISLPEYRYISAVG
jgi:hypothetical protein